MMRNLRWNWAFVVLSLFQAPAAFANEGDRRSASFTPRPQAAREKTGAGTTIAAGLLLGTALNAGAGFGTLFALYEPSCILVRCDSRLHLVPSVLLLGLAMGLPSGAVTALAAALEDRAGRLWVPLVVGPLFAAAQVSLALTLARGGAVIGLLLTTPLTAAFASVVAFEVTSASMDSGDDDLAAGPRWFPIVGVTQGGAVAGAVMRF